jgi:protein TonB
MPPPSAATLTLDAPLPEARAAVPEFARPTWLVSDAERAQSRLTTTQVATLVLWVGCLSIGVLGFVMPYSRPHLAAPAPEPVVVEKIAVELTHESLPAATLQPLDPLSPPPPPAALAEPQSSQPIAVAEASAVAFALPVEGPTVVVSADQASHAGSTISSHVATNSNLPAAQTLVFGQGEGRQPAPEYPARCMKLGQEGVVGVRLTVNPDGRVASASVAQASPYPLLDDSAERTVRHRWRFAPGPVRVYEVSIRFALAK